MSARVLLHAITFLVVPIAAIPLAAQDATGRGYCATLTSDSVVYVTPVFDTKLKAGSPYRSQLMGLEYNQYIKGRFDYAHSDPHSATCGSYETVMQAESGRQTLELQVTRANGRVVPVTWAYQPDSAEVQFSFNAQPSEGGYGPAYKLGPNDKGFCVTESFSTPMYISSVFDLPTPGLGEAPRAWTKFLAAKYGYKGQGVDPTKQNPTHCGDGGWGDPARMVRARIAGAKAAGRKIVETGWKPGDAAPAAAPAPPAPPSAELREAATKDGSEALTFCQSDRMLNGALNCYMVQRTVYNYRMANGPGLSVAELLANDKLDCTNCINPMNADMWATSRAQSNGFSLPKAKCVGPKFVAALKAKPYVNRVKELFEAAMKACPK